MREITNKTKMWVYILDFVKLCVTFTSEIGAWSLHRHIVFMCQTMAPGYFKILQITKELHSRHKCLHIYKTLWPLNSKYGLDLWSMCATNHLCTEQLSQVTLILQCIQEFQYTHLCAYIYRICLPLIHRCDLDI